MQPADTDQAQFRTLRIIALAMLILAPLIYLVVASVLDRQGMAEEGTSDMVMYILLIVSLAQGGLAGIVRKFQIQNYRKNKDQGMSPAQFYTTAGIVTLAFVEAVFVFGLVVFLLTGAFVNMLWFYLIGAVWAAVYWPRRDRFESFIREMQRT